MEQTSKKKTARPYSPEFRERAVRLRDLGLKGVLRGKKVVTRKSDTSQPCPEDKVNRGSPRQQQTKAAKAGASPPANGNAALACGCGSSIAAVGLACWWPKGV
jgi:hypothetical protein